MKKKIRGTEDRPRLYIFKSNKNIYAQLINDSSNNIILSSSSISKEIKNQVNSSVNCKIAKIIGLNIAKKFKKKGIGKIVFDRGQKKYHGKIKALAESLRSEGIIF
uniref:Large ribosomal subunit protein uL18c n=1 Tax=Rhodymenia pseudopalmata TaxID=31502 RepID=A0A1C9C7W0_RHOPU|nr:ribosomal protein L18 [Rhodymenia pseudopalmata]AOM64464.1 ribosomal protein L18 [Rhodymenia pseudopalmata]